MWCPRCNQGKVIAAQIAKNQTLIWVCEECEATWFSEQDIGSKPFVHFGSYMESLGLKPLWDEITILENTYPNHCEGRG